MNFLLCSQYYSSNDSINNKMLFLDIFAEFKKKQLIKIDRSLLDLADVTFKELEKMITEKEIGLLGLVQDFKREYFKELI